MTPDERSLLQALKKQTNKNTLAIAQSNEATSTIADAIRALGDTLTPLAENLALANALLIATGSLCAELAAEAAKPHERLEQILASFETSISQAISEHPYDASRPAVGQRVQKHIDMLREIAERTLQERVER